MNAIETHALTRRFGAHTAVDGLDLTVRQGELFALLGVNGAGKTTTLRMLSGLLQPTGGEADILGFRLTQQSQEIKRGRAQPGQNALRRLAAAAFHRYGADLAAAARISG